MSYKIFLELHFERKWFFRKDIVWNSLESEKEEHILSKSFKIQSKIRII